MTETAEALLREYWHDIDGLYSNGPHRFEVTFSGEFFEIWDDNAGARYMLQGDDARCAAYEVALALDVGTAVALKALCETLAEYCSVLDSD